MEHAKFLLKDVCCENCKFNWEFEDWTDYPNGRHLRRCCGLFAKEKFIMALCGDLSRDMCEEFKKAT